MEEQTPVPEDIPAISVPLKESGAKEKQDKSPIPSRNVYVHEVCNAQTRLTRDTALALRDHPEEYEAVYCNQCQKFLPVVEFVWLGTDQKVGT